VKGVGGENELRKKLSDEAVRRNGTVW